MSAVSRAWATSADAIPAPEPRPRSRGSVATPTTSLISSPSTSTGWCEPDGHRLAVLDRDHHHRAAGRDPLAQRGGAGGRLGRGVQRRVADVGRGRPGGRTRSRRPAGSAAARVVGAHDVEPDTGREQQLDRVGGDQQRQLVDHQTRRHGPRRRPPASTRAPTPGAGRPAASCSGDAARTSSAVTAAAARAGSRRVGPGRFAERDVERAGRPRSARPGAARRRSSARCSRAAPGGSAQPAP